MTEKKLLKRFQNDIGALRAHHWMYYVDLYSSCYYSCKYCLYYLNEHRKIDGSEFLSQLEDDLVKIKNKGIVYVGAKADIYQPIEKESRLMRRSLEIFLKHKIPIFIITRSDLIIRDLDILAKMASENLVEVSITINTDKKEFSNLFEPNTLSHKARMNIAKTLISHGIKVSYHFSPIIPYLDSYADIYKMIDEMYNTGGECIYGCIFGLPRKNKDLILSNLKKIVNFPIRNFIDLYQNHIDEIVTPNDSFIFEYLEPISQYCRDRNIPFICSQIPYFDTITRTNGIFDYKLPTIGDMYYFLVENNMQVVKWNELQIFLETHYSVDNEYIEKVREYWDMGILFKNTNYCFNEIEQVESKYYSNNFVSLSTNVIKCK